MLQTSITIQNRSCEIVDIEESRFKVRLEGYQTWTGLMPTVVKDANIAKIQAKYPFLAITVGQTFDDGAPPTVPTYIPYSEKGAAAGVATLGSGGKIPLTQYDPSAVVMASEKGAANGVAQLDATGKLKSSQIPEMEIIIAEGSSLILNCQ